MTKERLGTITKDTLIPLTFVIAIISAVVSSIWFTSRLDYRVELNSKQTLQNQQDILTIKEDVSQISTDVKILIRLNYNEDSF